LKPSAENHPDFPPVRFRDYEPEDFPTLCDLDKICFAPAIAYDPEEIAAALLQPRTFCIVAEERGHVIGFILLHYRRAIGHLITIDLSPAHRRRGLGSRLLKIAEDRLVAVGVGRLVLEVATNNEGAIEFYRNWGFAKQRLLPHYYREGTDAYLMEKLL
jgi:ribosomal-protein-alanine N-acetyltransferase